MRAAFALLLSILAASSLAAADIHLLADRSFGRTPVSGVAAVASPRGTLVAWTEPDGVRVARLEDPSRSVQLPRWGAEFGTSFHLGPAIATSGEAFLIVWGESLFGDTRYLAMRIAADLTLLDSRPIFLEMARNREAEAPTVVWNGTDYIAGWPRTLGRISPQGAVLEVRSYGTPRTPRVAASGNTTLVPLLQQKGITRCGCCTAPYCTVATFSITGSMIGEHGATSTTAALTNEARNREILAAAGSDNGFLIATVERGRTNEPGLLTLASARRGGTPVDNLIFMSVGAVPSPQIVLAGHRDGFLAAWIEGGSLHLSQLDERGRRVGRSLTVAPGHDVGGPLALVRTAPQSFLLLYPRSAAGGTPNVVVRELTIGTTKMRPVRH